jgi:MoxR-like ATPase
MSADATSTVQQAAQSVIQEVRKIYVGSDDTIETLLIALLSGGHVLLEGVPGIAKTTLVKAFAQALGCDFRRIQFTPDLLPSDITGTNVLDVKDNTFVLRRGPLFGSIVLGDEINRAPAKTQSALLEAMQERQITIDGDSVPLPAPFMVLATQNPIEHEGVYRLPEAQVDRFLFRLSLGYPTPTEEETLLKTYSQPLEDVCPVLTPSVIADLAGGASAVFMDEDLMRYVTRLVGFTRTHPSVLLGGSPRASLALMVSSKARAHVHGRAFVLPDDIAHLAPLVLEHRIILTPEADLDGVTTASIVRAALNEIPHSSSAADR